MPYPKRAGFTCPQVGLLAAAFVGLFLSAGLAQADMSHDMEMPASKYENVQVASAPDEVMIDNFSFSPISLTVAPGTKVTWTNHDDVPHTVVSSDDPHAFKSPPLDTDDSFSIVFSKPGVYKYFCSVHPMMVGTVVVRGQ